MIAGVIEVEAVADDAAGEMITVTEEEAEVVDTVVIGQDLVAPEETEDIREVEADLLEDDGIEALEGVEAVLQIIAINEEREAFHLEDLLVLAVMERAEVKVGVDLAHLNTMVVEEVSTQTVATTNPTNCRDSSYKLLVNYFATICGA